MSSVFTKSGAVVLHSGKVNIDTGVCCCRPHISSFFPYFGIWHGGTVVDIYGSNFKNTASVRFDGVNAAGFHFIDSTHIQATTAGIGQPGAGYVSGNVEVSNASPFDAAEEDSQCCFLYEIPPATMTLNGFFPNSLVDTLGSNEVRTWPIACYIAGPTYYPFGGYLFWRSYPQGSTGPPFNVTTINQFSQFRVNGGTSGVTYNVDFVASVTSFTQDTGPPCTWTYRIN